MLEDEHVLAFHASSKTYVMYRKNLIYTEQKKKGILNLVLNYAFFI